MSQHLDVFNRLAPQEQARALTLYAQWFHNRPVMEYEDLGDLLAEPDEPLSFLVEGLLARGHLAMLAGRPKSGKSWLALQLAQAVNTGQPFLGRATHRGRVFFAALEDTRARLRRRSNVLGIAPQDFKFVRALATLDDRYTGRGDGLAQIEEAARDFDLVVIDTLPAMLSGFINENDNAAMGAIVRALAAITHATNCAILAVHHTNKGFGEDSFNAMRGASALRGGYDLGMVLTRKGEEREAVLEFESRDGPVTSLTIRQGQPVPAWEVVGAAQAIQRIRAGRRVVEALAELGDGTKTEEVAAHLGISRSAANQQLVRAERDGLVARSAANPKAPGGRPTYLWRGVPGEAARPETAPPPPPQAPETT